MKRDPLTTLVALKPSRSADELWAQQAATTVLPRILDTLETGDAHHGLDTTTTTGAGGQARPAGDRSGLGRSRLFPALAAAAAVLTVVTVTLATLGLPGDEGTSIAALQARNADGSFYLIDEPTWQVSGVTTSTTPQGKNSGEVTFTGPDEALIQLSWAPARVHEDTLTLLRSESAVVEDTSVDGATATLFGGAEGDDWTLMWLAQDRTLQLRGPSMPRDVFLAAAADLTRVDESTWVAALPESVVTVDETEATIAQMLDGVPTPDGFDPASIPRPEDASDAYQLGAAVSGAVTCAWVAQWDDGRLAGDTPPMNEAAQAMATSRNWPVLQDMTAEGDYPYGIWGIADFMNGDPTATDGGGDPPTADTLRPRTEGGLGCSTAAQTLP